MEKTVEVSGGDVHAAFFFVFLQLLSTDDRRPHAHPHGVSDLGPVIFNPTTHKHDQFRPAHGYPCAPSG